MRLRLPLFAALLAAVLFFHFPILSGWFQVDDFLWLRLADWHDVLRSFAGTWGHGVAYRPLMRISFYLDDLLFGWHGEFWHAENLLIFGIDCYLLYGLARRLEFGVIAALAGALLFAAAPIGVENVDWISGRTGLLSLALTLAAINLWIDGKSGAAALLYIASLATYEAGLVLPLLLVCLAPWMKSEQNVPYSLQARSILLIGLTGALFWTIRSLMLGMAGAAVDAPMPSVWAALTVNIPTYPSVLRLLWGGNAVLGVAFGLAMGTLRRHLRPAVWALLAMSAVMVLPFLMAQGWAARFSFAMQAPLCLLLAAPIAAIPTGLRYAYLGVIGLFLWEFTPATHLQASEMAEAGQFDREIVERIAAIPADPNDILVFDTIPDDYKHRSAISTKFEDAMVARLHRPGLIVREADLAGRPDWAAAIAKGPTRRFHFDLERRDFTETTP